jgi:organic hydroperoxide reductase OsmC/OhrA
MQEFPHHYSAAAAAQAHGEVELTSTHLPAIQTAFPSEFDGPGDRWSPETLLVGAIGDCFVLTFRGVARASKLPWMSLKCQVTGTLDRVERVTQFTAFEVVAHLDVPAGTSADAARRALEKAERNCLISNSLKGTLRLLAEVHVAAEPISELRLA